jgi:Tol biopolymer transport system component
MDEQMLSPFEARLSARLRPYAERAVVPVDAAAVAHAVVSLRPRTRTMWTQQGARMLVRLALAALLLLALIAAALLIPGVHRPDALGGNGLIVFATKDSINVANADGSAARILVSGLGEASFPTWSPDGTRIAFWSRSSTQALAALEVLDPQTGSHTVITGLNAQSGPVRILWAPDGRRIAFAAFSDQAIPEVVIVGVDGTGRRSLAPGLQASDPAWSPDGRQIAFRAPDPADLEAVLLYAAVVDEAAVRVVATVHREPISDEISIGVHLDWSPDGTRIAYASKGFTPAGGYVITIADVATGTIHDITSGSYDRLPTWSPDGRWIAFSRGGTGDPNAAGLVRPDGSDLRILSGPPIKENTLSWSPDGTHLVACDADLIQVVVIPTDGSAPSTLPAPAVNSVPSWQRLP